MIGSTRVLWLVTIVVLLYSALHFAESGVRFPLSAPNLGKFEEETPPLRAHLRTGDPVRINNAVQYGPVFFFVMHPLLRTVGDNERALAAWLYAIQIVCLVGSFLVTVATLKQFVPSVQVTARCTAWPESLVLQWVQDRIASAVERTKLSRWASLSMTSIGDRPSIQVNTRTSNWS